jgi:hypothetical protein
MSETLRQDQASCTLTVDGREMPFVFNKRDGGEIAPEGSKTFPGGGQTQRAHGGPPTVENPTATFEFVPARDLAEIKFLESRSGKGDASLVENGLDVDGNVFGRLNSWTGKLGRVNTGNYDSNSSDPREGEVEIEAHGTKG